MTEPVGVVLADRHGDAETDPLVPVADVAGLYPPTVAAVASALSKCNMTQPDGSTLVEPDD